MAKKKLRDPVYKNCLNCGSIFLDNTTPLNKKYCIKSCKYKHYWILELKKEKRNEKTKNGG